MGLLNEALAQFNSVYGAVHPEIVVCLRLLARIKFLLGDIAEVRIMTYFVASVLKAKVLVWLSLINQPSTIKWIFSQRIKSCEITSGWSLLHL